MTALWHIANGHHGDASYKARQAARRVQAMIDASAAQPAKGSQDQGAMSLLEEFRDVTRRRDELKVAIGQALRRERNARAIGLYTLVCAIDADYSNFSKLERGLGCWSETFAAAAARYLAAQPTSRRAESFTLSAPRARA